MDEKDACRILGVSEGADRTEITRRYEILLKRNKIARTEGAGDQAVVDLKEADKAYNLLMGYDTENMVEEYEIRENRVLQKAGLNEKRLRNFLYYYKYHLIIGLFILIVAGTTIGSFLKPASDFLLVFTGDFYYGDSGPLTAKITDNIPSIKHPTIDSALTGDNAAQIAEYNSDMKLAALLAAGDVDVFITDRQMYDRLAKQGAFMSLDSYTAKFGIDMDTNSQNEVYAQNEADRHLYGVDVSKSSFFTKPSVPGSVKIAAISIHVRHRDNAEKFIEYLIRTNQ